MASISTIEDVKTANRHSIFRFMRSQGPISRTRLASATGLSKATVTRILAEMLEEGLVEEVRTTESGGGRPHILLRLADRARFAIGIELTESVARVILTDINARPLKRSMTPLYNQDIDKIMDDLAGDIKDFCKDIPESQLVGVGVAVSGTVDVRTGLVNMGFSTGWHEIPLADRFAERIGLPVKVLNQAHAAAWGEKWRGAGHQVEDLLYIRLGTTVEGGLIIADHLHYGKALMAGAIGHMTLDPKGALCSCGNRGCLNTVASTPALLASIRTLLKDNSTSLLMGIVEGNPALLTLDHVMRAVEAGDGLVIQAFSEVGHALGVIVAGLLNLLSLEKVILGGPMSIAGNALLLPLQEEVNRRALPSSLVYSRIELTRLGADGASIGAASLILQNQMDARERV